MTDLKETNKVIIKRSRDFSKNPARRGNKTWQNDRCQLEVLPSNLENRKTQRHHHLRLI